MATLTNLSFEAGSAGTATAWTLTDQSSVEELDQFAGAIVMEGFELGWGISSVESSITPGLNGENREWTNPVGPTAIDSEAFEVGWSGNEHFETELVGEARGFVTGFFVGDEGFEGWSTLELDFGSSVSAGLDDFESGWGNDAFETVISPGGNATDMVFSGLRSQAHEDFEFVLGDALVIPSLSDGSIHYPSHPFSESYTAQVYNNAGLLPSGYADGVPYSIHVVDANNVILRVLGTSTSVVPSANGTGITYLTEPYEFWTVLLPF